MSHDKDLADQDVEELAEVRRHRLAETLFRTPHGKAIPDGRCCRTPARSPQPLVEPLDRLAVGQDARIIYIAPREPARLLRLSNLGVVPGATVHLQQRAPATVFRIGETTLAIEPEMAAEIYVEPAAAAGAEG